MNRCLILSALLALSTAAPAATDPLADARTFFDRWETLGNSFDPELATLYCTDAVVRRNTTAADGSVQSLEVKGDRYQALIRNVMPRQKENDERHAYDDVTYVAVDDGVRITATKRSIKHETAVPLSLLVGTCAGGGTGIREEITDAR